VWGFVVDGSNVGSFSLSRFDVSASSRDSEVSYIVNRIRIYRRINLQSSKKIQKSLMSLSFGNFSNSNNNTNTGLSFNNNNNNNKSNSNTGLSFSNNNNNMNNNMSSSSFANNNNNNMSMNMSSMNRNASIMSGRVREAQFGSLKPELQNYITQLGVKILREKIEAKIVSEHSNQRLQVLYQQVNRLETDLTDIRVSTDSAKSVVDRMRKRTNRDMNYVEEAQRVVLRRNEPPPIHSEVELPPMFFRDARQRCEEHMDFYTAQIDSMREILLPSGSRGSRGVSPSGGNNLMMRTDRGNTNFVLNSAGRFDRLGNGNAVSAQYGRRARVTAGDLKQIMQAQADAFFGMSSEIAALHEHVEMLKDKYLREIRREFRNTTSNQRDLMDSSRRNMSRWERGGDLGDRDPFKRRVLELEEEKRVWVRFLSLSLSLSLTYTHDLLTQQLLYRSSRIR